MLPLELVLLHARRACSQLTGTFHIQLYYRLTQQPVSSRIIYQINHAVKIRLLIGQVSARGNQGLSQQRALRLLTAVVA